MFYVLSTQLPAYTQDESLDDKHSVSHTQKAHYRPLPSVSSSLPSSLRSPSLPACPDLRLEQLLEGDVNQAASNQGLLHIHKGAQQHLTAQHSTAQHSTGAQSRLGCLGGSAV